MKFEQRSQGASSEQWQTLTWTVGLFQQKSKQGGLEHGISRCIEEKTWKFQRSSINEVEFLGWKKNGSENMWNVLGFGLGISKGCHTICGIFTGEALFFLEFPRVAIYTVKNKNSRGFIKKKHVPRYSNSTNSSLLFRFLDFSWNGSLWYYREVFIMDFPWTVTKN